MGGKQFPKPVKKKPGPTIDINIYTVPPAEGNTKGLSRSSLEAYGFAIIGILLAVMPMTWWLRGLGLLVLIPIAFDLIWNLQKTSVWGKRRKGAVSGLAVVAVTAIGLRILPTEYSREHPIANAFDSRHEQSEQLNQPTASPALTPLVAAPNPVTATTGPDKKNKPAKPVTAAEVPRPDCSGRGRTLILEDSTISDNKMGGIHSDDPCINIKANRTKIENNGGPGISYGAPK
jgi:hypothetical protein